MLTRGQVCHQYYPAPVAWIRTSGAVRVTMKGNNFSKGVPQVWPIMRPSTHPYPNGAPFYVTGHRINNVERAGLLALQLPQQKVEMDPTDQSTWQRSYRFS